MVAAIFVLPYLSSEHHHYGAAETRNTKNVLGGHCQKVDCVQLKIEESGGEMTTKLPANRRIEDD